MGPPLSSQYILKVSVSSCSAYKHIVLFSVNNWVKRRASGLRLKKVNVGFAWILVRHEIFFLKMVKGEEMVRVEKKMRLSWRKILDIPILLSDTHLFFNSLFSTVSVCVFRHCLSFSSFFSFHFSLQFSRKKDFFLLYYVQHFHFLLQKCLGNKLDTPRSTIASLINESWRTEKYS